MTDLFQQEGSQQEQIDNYYEHLVGDGKKFKDNETLAKAKYNSDLYVSHLEEQLDALKKDHMTLREEANTRAALEELLDQLKTPPSQSESTPKATEEPKPSFDPNQIKSLVSNAIQEHELTKRQTDNYNQVRVKLQEQLGSNYQNVLKDQIAQLGMTEEYANDLARNHPNAFFRMFGLDQPRQQQESFSAPPRSQQRSDSFAPSSPKRTWDYYQKLRKDKPDLYWNAKTQVQMYNDRRELGEAFKDGDYAMYHD